MHFVDEVAGVEQVGFTRSGRRAAHIDTPHGPGARQHDAAARGAPAVGKVAYLDTGHARDAAGIVGNAAHALGVRW